MVHSQIVRLTLTCFSHGSHKRGSLSRKLVGVAKGLPFCTYVGTRSREEGLHDWLAEDATSFLVSVSLSSSSHVTPIEQIFRFLTPRPISPTL